MRDAVNPTKAVRTVRACDSSQDETSQAPCCNNIFPMCCLPLECMIWGLGLRVGWVVFVSVDSSAADASSLCGAGLLLLLLQLPHCVGNGGADAKAVSACSWQTYMHACLRLMWQLSRSSV